jgi:hexosaminidase
MDNINHSNHLYELSLKQEFISDQKKLRFELKGTPNGKNIFYQLNDQSVKEYKEPFMVDGAGTIKVMSKLNDLQTDAIYYRYNISLASGKGVLLKTKADPPYHRAGSLAWANGVLGSETRYTDDEWLGWNGKDFEGVLKLDGEVSFSSLAVRFFNAPGSWVHLPAAVEVYASDDGVEYKLVNSTKVQGSAESGVKTISMSFPKMKTNFLKVVAQNHGIIAKGLPGEGNPAWLFVDEVVVK